MVIVRNRSWPAVSLWGIAKRLVSIYAIVFSSLSVLPYLQFNLLPVQLYGPYFKVNACECALEDVSFISWLPNYPEVAYRKVGESAICLKKRNSVGRTLC